jgi:gamma-glutamylcyclotransferase (GGCT)/AIG2-like uncharacterized protein YtfP
MTEGRFWWQKERFADDIQVALDQVNEARRRGTVRVRGWELDACKDCFGSLNRLWTTLSQLPEYAESALPRDKQSSESVRLTSLLKTLHSDQRSELLARPSVKAFAEFEPSIFSHGAMGVVTHFLQDVSPEARAAAAEDHEAFKRGWWRWQSTGARVPDVLRRLSRAVLAVRNNLAHGEKTRVGPDPARTERNGAVAKVVLPVLMDMLDFVLDHPSHKFVAYGTLRPGQPGHAIVKDVDGAWSSVTLCGVVHEKDGLPAFSYSGHADSVAAEILVSKDLPGHWRRLDEFEGARYERHLGLYHGDGALGIGNVYVWQDPDDSLL